MLSRGAQVSSGENGVEGLRLGLDPVAKQSDQAVSPPAVQRGSQDGSRRGNARQMPNGCHQLVGAGQRGIGIKRQGSFGGQPDLISFGQKQLGK